MSTLVANMSKLRHTITIPIAGLNNFLDDIDNKFLELHYLATAAAQYTPSSKASILSQAS